MKDDLANYRILGQARRLGFTPESEPTTLYVLQKWLRDVHRINVAPSYKMNIDKWDFITYDMNLKGREYVKFYREYYKDKNNRRFDSYPDALAAGIEEGLIFLEKKS